VPNFRDLRPASGLKLLVFCRSNIEPTASSNLIHIESGRPTVSSMTSSTSSRAFCRGCVCQPRLLGRGKQKQCKIILTETAFSNRPGISPSLTPFFIGVPFLWHSSSCSSLDRYLLGGSATCVYSSTPGVRSASFVDFQFALPPRPVA
jgi:hypothetical protein